MRPERLAETFEAGGDIKHHHAKHKKQSMNLICLYSLVVFILVDLQIFQLVELSSSKMGVVKCSRKLSLTVPVTFLCPLITFNLKKP